MVYFCLAAFIAGMLVDGTAVFWVHYSERGEALKTAFFAMIQATAMGTDYTGNHFPRRPFRRTAKPAPRP